MRHDWELTTIATPHITEYGTELLQTRGTQRWRSLYSNSYMPQTCRGGGDIGSPIRAILQEEPNAEDTNLVIQNAHEEQQLQQMQNPRPFQGLR